MTYALIQNNQVVAYPYSLTTFQQDNPNVCLPQDPTETQLNEQGIYTVYATPMPYYNAVTQDCTQGEPEQTSGAWYETWVVTPATPEEIAQRELQQQQENKSQAESLLQATDWTATVDINDPQYSNPYLDNQPEFLAYRSSVRKIAVNPPTTPAVFPDKPNEVWVTVPAE